MRVKLKRDVYLDKLYRKDAWGTEIPEEWRDKLPPDAVIMTGDGPLKPAPSPPKQTTLSAMGKKRPVGALGTSDDHDDLM